jgi:hypothetical protein
MLFMCVLQFCQVLLCSTTGWLDLPRHPQHIKKNDKTAFHTAFFALVSTMWIQPAVGSSHARLFLGCRELHDEVCLEDIYPEGQTDGRLELALASGLTTGSWNLWPWKCWSVTRMKRQWDYGSPEFHRAPLSLSNFWVKVLFRPWEDSPNIVRLSHISSCVWLNHQRLLKCFIRRWSKRLQVWPRNFLALHCLAPQIEWYSLIFHDVLILAWVAHDSSMKVSYQIISYHWYPVILEWQICCIILGSYMGRRSCKQQLTIIIKLSPGHTAAIYLIIYIILQ